MKFIISSSVLQKNLQLLSGVLSTNNTLPILDNFLFTIKEGILTVSASDLETTMTTNVNVEAKEDGNIAIPAKDLLDSIKTFPEQPLSFDIDHANNSVEMLSDNGKYKLTGYNGDEFPKTPSIQAPSVFKIDTTVLSHAINKTIFATGSDELRPVMSGVYFEIDKDNVTFVATDAHKLVRYRKTGTEAVRSASFIIPKKPLNLLKNILSTTGTPVTIEYNETNCMFSLKNITLICRLIDGKYPNYNAVIPTNNPNKLIIDKVLFLNSLKRIINFSNRTTHQVRLKITGNELHISAEDLDFAKEANERLTCSYQGEDMEIGFNARFLIEMLTNIEAENVLLEMSAPNKAGILLPSEKSDKTEDVLMLVMPVMLN